MFDIGGSELLLILILGLLVFGPRRLPQLGRQLGGFMAQMRQAMNEFKGTLEREVAMEDLKAAGREIQGIKQDLRTVAEDLTGFGPPPYADPERRARQLEDPVSPSPDEPVLTHPGEEAPESVPASREPAGEDREP